MGSQNEGNGRHTLSAGLISILALSACTQPRRPDEGIRSSPWVCIGISSESSGSKIFQVMKAADIEATEGDSNLGIFAVEVRQEDAERAIEILLETRPPDDPWYFKPIDSWIRETLPRRLSSEVTLDGQRRLEQGKYAEAVGYLDVAIRIQPSPETYGSRAYALLKRGQLKSAQRDFSKARELSGTGLEWSIPHYRELKLAFPR